MDVETILAMVSAAIGILLTPVYVVLLVRGVRTLRDMRDLMGRPPGDYGRLGARRQRLQVSDDG